MQKNSKRIIVGVTVFGIVGIGVFAAVNAQKIRTTFNPDSYADQQDKKDNEVDYSSSVFGADQKNDDGLEMDENSEDDYNLDEGDDKNLLDNQEQEDTTQSESGTNAGQALQIADNSAGQSDTDNDSGGADQNSSGNTSSNVIGVTNDGSGTVIAGPGGNTGNSGTGSENGNSGTGGAGGEGKPDSGGTGGGGTGEGDKPSPDTPTPTPPEDTDDPQTPEDPYEDVYGTDYEAPENVNTYVPDQGVTIKEIKVTAGNLKQHFYEGEAPRIAEMSSYITVKAVLSNGKTQKLNYRINDETGGDYQVSWENNPGNEETNSIGYSTVGSEVGTYTATITYQGFEVKETYDIVHWQVTLNDFEGENQPDDMQASEYAVFPKTLSPEETPLLDLENDMQYMYNLIGARTFSMEEESGFTYQHINVKRDGVEEWDPYYVEFFGGWTASLDEKSTGNTYKMVRPTDKQIVDGVYNVELLPTWNTLHNQGEYTVALDGWVGYYWTTKLLMYTGSDSTLRIPEGITTFSIVDYDLEQSWPENNSENITKLVLPESLEVYENEWIPEQYINLFPNLEEIEVSKNNQYFMSIDGVMYNKTGKLLLFVPPAKKSITQWSSRLETIAANAFQYTDMENVSIPKSVTKCEAYSFYNACIDNLVLQCEGQLTIGASVFDGKRFDEFGNPAAGISRIDIRANELKWADGNAVELYPELNTYMELWRLPFSDAGLQIVVADSENDEIYKSRLRLFQDGIDGYIGDSNAAYSILTTKNAANMHYRYQDGLLLSADGTQCIQGSKQLSGDILIPEGVEVIAENAFDGCAGITSLNLPSSVKAIQSEAFANMEALSALYMRSEKPPVMGSRILGETLVDGFKIYVSNRDLFIKTESVRLDKDYGKGTADKIFATIENLDQAIIDNGNLYFQDEAGNYQLYKVKESVQGIFTPMEGTTKFLGGCFSNCRNLKAVILPDTLQYIGANVFSECTSLKYIVSNANVAPEIQADTFYGIEKAEITLHLTSEGMVQGTYAAWDGFSLNDRAEDTYIYEEGSGRNQGIYGVSENGLTLVCASVNSSDIFRLHDNTIEIAANAFQGSDNLTGVSNGDTVQRIGDYAFEGCSQLQGIELGIVDSLGIATFRNCTNLTNLTGTRYVRQTNIPSSLTSIPEECFAGCSGLRQVWFESNMQSMGTGAFRDCRGLGKVASQNPEDDGYYYSVPYAMTEIPVSCFEGCSSLDIVSIPDGMERIGDRAFYGCTSLERSYNPDEGEPVMFELPGYLAYIGAESFGACTSLQNVMVYSEAVTIGDAAFGGDTSLQSVNFAVIPQNITDTSDVDAILNRYFAECPLTSLLFGDTEMIVTIIPEKEEEQPEVQEEVEVQPEESSEEQIEEQPEGQEEVETEEMEN